MPANSAVRLVETAIAMLVSAVMSYPAALPQYTTFVFSSGILVADALIWRSHSWLPALKDRPGGAQGSAAFERGATFEDEASDSAAFISI